MAKHYILLVFIFIIKRQTKNPDHKSPVERPDYTEMTSPNPKKILSKDSMDLHYFPRTWRICLSSIHQKDFFETSFNYIVTK